MAQTNDQNNPIKKVSINCPEQLWETVSIEAVKARKTVQDMFLDAIREYLDIPAEEPKTAA